MDTIQLTIDENKTEGTVEFREELTIRNVAENAAVLRNALTRFQCLKIRHSEVSLFDISYIQLLLSSEKMARQAKKKIYLDGPQSESFQILLKNSGCMAVPAIRKLLRIGEEERKSDE